MIDDTTVDDFDKYVTPARPKRQREFRTDRNNNPIAAAVTTGGRNQFTDALDQAEIPWEHGDPFPNNPKLSTIKIKGDPIEGARAILSNSNALKWYRSTTGKDILPKYGVRSSADFSKLPIEHQNDIINGIYQSEGGSGKIKPTQDDFDKYVSRETPPATPQQPTQAAPEDDDFDKYVTQSKEKTPQVSVKLGEGAEMASPEEIKQYKPVSFQPSGPIRKPTINPVEALSELTDEKTVQPRGLAKLQSREYQEPQSRGVGERVRINPKSESEDDVVNSYLSTLGPEYVALGQKYKQETGHNILTLGGGAVKFDKDGAYIRPTRGAVDFINAYAHGGLNEALPLAERQRREFIQAQETARLKAQPAIERARRAVEMEKQNPVERGLFTAGSGPASAAGTIAKIARYATPIGLATAATGVRDPLANYGEELQRGGQEMRAVGEQAEQEKPLKSLSEGEKALYGAGALIPTAATLIGTRGFGSAQLPALGALEGQTPAERIKGGLEGGAMQAALGPIPSQLGESLPNAARRTVGAGTLAAIPTAQAVHGGEPLTSALVQNLPFAAMGALENRAPERPTELGIERAPETGVRGEVTQGIDETLAAREAKVQPTFLRDDQGQPVARVLNPEEVAQGAKPKVRAIHQSDIQARDESGKFTEQVSTPPAEATAPLLEPTPPQEASATELPAKPPMEAAQPVKAETTAIPPETSRVEVAPKETQPPTQPPESTTSARKDQLAQDRAELDLPELPAPERRGWRTALINAKEKGLDGRAERLADQILKNPRALDDEQTAGMVLRLQQLKNEHAKLMDEILGETDPDVVREKRADVESIEDAFDKISAAVKASGTEKGRNLASQKLTINQDYDLVSMLNRYKVKTGKEPSPEIRAEIEGYQKRISDLEKQVADQQIQPTVKKMQREARREQRQITRKALDEEAALIRQNIAAEFARLSKQQAQTGRTAGLFGLGNLDPEGVVTRETLKYVRNRVQAGITDSAQLVDDVHGVLSEFLDGVTKRQVAELISGYNRPSQTRSELQQQVEALKAQMRRELAQADVEAGVRTERRQGPSLREAVGKPEGPQLGARQGPTLREGIGKREGPELGPKQGPRPREGFRQIEGPRLSEGTGRKEGPRITEAPKFGPRETKEAIQKRYQKQIDELQRRIREQDFAPKPKRGETVLDADTRRTQVQLERAKQDYDRALRKWQQSQRSSAERVADLLIQWGRAAKLSYVSTLGKLSSAATGRMVMSPLENLIGEIPHRLSPELSRKATTEGGGFDHAAEVAALWKSGRFRQVLDQITKGSSDLDVLFGPQGKLTDKELQSHGILGIPGRVHGALKEYPRQAEFDRARLKVLKNYEQQGRDITRPDVQLSANMEAFNAAERARFQQRNFISDTFNDAMRRLEQKGGAAKAAAKVGKFIFPITRVPVNVVGETLNYTFGLPRAAIETAIRGGVKNLTPEQANNIMRAYKKGGIGLAVMAYAFLNPQQFGGYYQPNDRRSEKEPKPGEIMAFGYRIPKWATHIPILEAAQLGATTRRVMDKLTEKGESKTQAVTGGVTAGGVGLASQIPFYETPGRLREGLTTDPGRLAGQQVKGLIPGFVQEFARATDKNDAGDTVSRKRSGFVQEIQEGIPYARRSLPESRTERMNFKSRLIEKMRDGKDVDLDSLEDKGKLSKGERKAIEKESALTPRQATFEKAFPDAALSRYERMDQNQRMEVESIMQKKAWSLLNSDKLTDEQKEEFRKRLDAVDISPQSPYKKVSYSPFQERMNHHARSSLSA